MNTLTKDETINELNVKLLIKKSELDFIEFEIYPKGFEKIVFESTEVLDLKREIKEIEITIKTLKKYL